MSVCKVECGGVLQISRFYKVEYLFFSSSFNLIVTSTLLQSFNRSLFLGHLDFLRITKLAMGGAPSTAEPAASKAKLHRNEKEIVKLMMPVYYTVQEVSIEERKLASNSWDLILNEKSPEFLSKKGDPDFPYQSCVTFFYDSFYLRLFDVHPLCKQLFKKGMKSHGKFLVKMISLALSELDDPDKFDKNLVKLSEVHFQRGVKAVECKCKNSALA